MHDFEKLGLFYLGREFDARAQQTTDRLLLYDAKDLTTHAVCVGMTGSGKTGLCISLLEEAAIDGIPAICIDPKGDIGNLLLAFPELRPADFAPWVDPAEAARQGIAVDELAEQTARRWREGLAQWGQDGERIERYRQAVDIAIYTPGSTAGLPLTVLRSLQAPPPEIRDDAEALGDRISAAVAGLLGLVGIQADPLRSREHILLSSLLDHHWRAGEDLTLAELIHALQQPPFQRVGVLDLESFYPASERFALAMQINNLLASPGFSAWMQGEPLDVRRLLFTEAGKPRLSVISIAHLSDSERMFFVTLLLNEVIAWMRGQSGTSSLRAIVYMDEIFGYFPPTANPPSKKPLLTLMKQARAFGVGMVLATQNPVDLDYKGLANAGTWFLGRLQTERDKLRVLEGLEGASAAAGAAFNRQQMEALLASLGNRVFLMNNVHEDQPVLFQTRWALSYLRGPMTRSQIEAVMAPRKRAAEEATATVESRPTPSVTGTASGTGERPVLPPDVPQRFVSRRGALQDGDELLYRPALLGEARLHFVSASLGVDHWQDIRFLADIGDDAGDDPWRSAEAFAEPFDFDDGPERSACFADLPGPLFQPKQYAVWARTLKDHLYRTQTLSLWRYRPLKQISLPGETQGEFRARLALAARQFRDEKVEKLRARYAPKFKAIEERLRRAEQRVEKEKSQASQQTFQAAISFGASVLSALTGRKLASRGNIGRAATSARAAGRVFREREDIGHAEQSVEALRRQIGELEEELRLETDKLHLETHSESLELEEASVKCRKSDIGVSQVALAWIPYRRDSGGAAVRLIEASTNV